MVLMLFLLVCCVLFARVVVDRSAVRKSDQKIRKDVSWFKARQQSWHECVSDRVLEENLQSFISNSQNYDEVWREVHSAFLHMQMYRGKTSIAIFSTMVDDEHGPLTPKQREEKIRSNRKMALDIMLARRGKVRDVNTWGNGFVAALSLGDGQHTKALWDETFELWLYIRDELRRNGVSARLIFQTAESQPHRRTAYDADDVEEFRYKHGTLTWLPLTYFNEDLKQD